ncbi:hypothetical protein N869_01375 [Cellulomonas bogoriensis 69B4 = DSM 16987]|uniref:Uncharacterized protein n=1 Tax=Cellulomonas bogoriensis 69B4 = DSM 16987 TaxID=1386082 RepID=A0A0A0C246_9CELL|nr:hypothetical protein N869_01375 [Cellulomonas bogoriensis 69B4 = DSM 16987]
MVGLDVVRVVQVEARQPIAGPQRLASAPESLVVALRELGDEDTAARLTRTYSTPERDQRGRHLR